MTGDERITGTVVITFADRMRALFGMSRWFLPNVAGGTLVGLGFILGTATLPSGQGGIVLSAIVATLGLALLWFSWIPAIYVASLYWRFSEGQRQVTYEIDAEKLLARDAVGHITVVPWSLVRRVRESSRAFHFETMPAGSVYVPKRAFSMPALQTLKALTRVKLNKAAGRGEAS